MNQPEKLIVNQQKLVKYIYIKKFTTIMQQQTNDLSIYNIPITLMNHIQNQN